MHEIKYCPKCHKEAYRLVEEGDTIKVIQNERVILNIGRSSHVSMNMSCPSGHQVKLEIKGKEREDGSKKD